jgi:hypothetical protein
METDGKPVIGAPLTLAGARQLAVELQRDRARGVDVVGRRKVEKLALTTADAKTFGVAAKDFVSLHARPKQRRWKLTSRFLGLDPATLVPFKDGLADRWRARPLAEITDDDCFALIEECRERGTPGIIRRRVEGPSEDRAAGMFATLSTFFRWCIGRRRLKVNPLASLARPKPPASRERVLSAVLESNRRRASRVRRAVEATAAHWMPLAGDRRSEMERDIRRLYRVAGGENQEQARAHRAIKPAGA